MWFPLPKHHRKSRTVKERKFKSKLEEKFWDELRICFNQCVVEYESESVPYVLARRYRPDFVIERPDGSKTYIETKGYLRPTDRTKMVAVKRDNPGLDIRIIFAADNKIAGSKMKYSDWANKYGFPYAVGKVPKKWIKK